jgi:hypothetical protein
MSLAKNIQDALNAQDVELANAITELKGDPAKLADFMSSRKSDLYNTVTAEHSDSFKKVYGDLQRSSDTTKNILYYAVRNKDLDNLQEQIFARTRAEAENATYDSQTAKRQFEANEWTSGNKNDTLFFFQLLFIGLTLTAPLLYMQKTGMIPTTVFYGVTGLVMVALVLTVVVRAQYTEKTRDQTFWNRRRFQQMGGPPTPPTCEAIQAYAKQGIEAAQEIGSNVTQDLAAATTQNVGLSDNPLLRV